MINSAYTPPLDLIRRPRRNRQTAAIRALVRENRVLIDDLIHTNGHRSRPVALSCVYFLTLNKRV